MPKSKYKPLKKSKSNTSGKPSAAKKEALERKKKTKKPKTAKVTKPAQYNVKLSALNPQKPRQLPETPLSKKGMTLRKLLRSTPKLFLRNAENVLIKEFKQTRTKSGMPAVSAVVFTSDPFRPNKLRRNHRVHIIGLDKNADNLPDLKTPINKHKRVLVSCPCESYVFGGAEYANAAHGAARIVYGNGKPPVVTNPKLAPFLCKHCVSVARAMIKRDI